MTKLLELAFKKASELPSEEQNIVAKWLIEELEAEKKWENSFAASEDLLLQMAEEAEEDFKKEKQSRLTSINEIPSYREILEILQLSPFRY